jgi:hypothetical protein
MHPLVKPPRAEAASLTQSPGSVSIESLLLAIHSDDSSVDRLPGFCDSNLFVPKANSEPFHTPGSPQVLVASFSPESEFELHHCSFSLIGQQTQQPRRPSELRSIMVAPPKGLWNELRCTGAHSARLMRYGAMSKLWPSLVFGLGFTEKAHRALGGQSTCERTS